MRIRNQLLLLVLSILLPAMLASGLAVGYVYKEGQKSQHRSLTEAAHAFAFNVEAELETKTGMLRTLSNAPSLLRGDLKAFYFYAKRMAPTPETTLILVDENGRQLLNTRRPLGAALPSKRVSNVDALMQKYGADRPLISDVFMAPVGGRHDFMIQVPVQTSQGRRQYLVMGINASMMQSIVSRQNFPSSWITTIVDRHGVVVARSHKPTQYVGTQIRERSRQILASSYGGMYESVTLDGIPVKAYFHRVPNSGWTVLINIPKAELADLPTRAAAFLGGIILAVLAIALFAAHWMAQRAYRPVEQLGKAAGQLKMGQEVAYVPQGLHEVDSVGQQLAEASRQIRHATQELENRVAEAVAKTEQAQQSLQRSQKLEALGRLTGGIAHEFNNLLQTLMTALQVARMTSNQERVQAMLDTCKKAVNRATALTSQLSAFGRIQESRLTTIDLNEQILGFRKLIEGILPTNIKLELRLAHSV